MARFNKKAVVLYAALQKAKGSKVTLSASETSGTITTTVGSKIVTGVGTKFLTEATEGAYIYYGTSEVGRIATIDNDLSITLYDNVPAAATLAVPKVSTAKSTAVTGVSYSFGLGNANAIAAFTPTGSLESTTDSAQFAGDELDRDMLITETDRFWKEDFEIYMPALGELNINNTLEAGTGAIRRGATALDKIVGTATTFVTDGIVANKKLYTTDGLFIGVVDGSRPITETRLYLKDPVSPATLVPSVVGGTAIAFKFNSTISPEPTIDQIPYRIFFEMLGLHPITSAGKIEYSNSVPGDNFLELEVRLSSADQPGTEKVRRLTDVVGTVDLTLDAIGKRIMLKMSTMGNYQGIFGLPARIPAYGNQKFSHADPINSTEQNANVVKTVLVPYTARSRVTFDTTAMVIGDTISLGGLVFTASTTATRAQMISAWESIPEGTQPTDLDTTYGTWSGTALTGYSTYNDGISTSSLIVQASDPLTPIYAVPFGGSSANLADFTVDALTSAPMMPSASNICIGKLSVTNLAGFLFNRFMFTCETGWSKGATQGDLTLSITEGAADTSYEPEDFIGIPHRLQIVYGSGKYNTRVSIDIDKLTLERVSGSELADFRAQDLAFKITGNTTITLS